MASEKKESRTPSAASSQYRGVSFNNHSQKWKAVITVGRKQFFLGYFALETEAARAYDKASIDLRGPDAPTNFRYDPAAIQAFSLASAQHKAQMAANSAAAAANAGTMPETQVPIVSSLPPPPSHYGALATPPLPVYPNFAPAPVAAGNAKYELDYNHVAMEEAKKSFGGSAYDEEALLGAFLLQQHAQNNQHFLPASLEKLDSKTSDSMESVRDVEMELNAIRATLMQQQQQQQQHFHYAGQTYNTNTSGNSHNSNQMRNGKDIPSEFLCL